MKLGGSIFLNEASILFTCHGRVCIQGRYKGASCMYFKAFSLLPALAVDTVFPNFCMKM